LTPDRAIAIAFTTHLKKSQSHVAITMMKRYEESQESRALVVLYERSLRGCREVFLQQGLSNLDRVDASFLTELCEMGERLYEGGQVQLSIYMTCTDEEMLARVRSRAREEEALAS
jgi:deoxyadenosine/deoxycytidine kinase